MSQTTDAAPMDSPAASKSKSALKAVRGTRDLLPDQTSLWNHVERTARELFARYGFGEIRTPLFEATELFARGVGEETDIVSKEMFTWEDTGRFDEGSMQSAWLAKHRDEVTLIGRVKSNPDLLVVKRIALDAVEVVGFKPSITQASIDQLRVAKPEITIEMEVHPVHLRLVTLLQAYLSSPWAEAQDVEFESLLGTYQSGGQSLTLRPESTAGVMRAYIEHKLGDTGLLQKLYYIGPQFRRERPQRGRYRQFWQIGAEVIGPASSGAESPLRDAEILEMLSSLLDELGVRDWRLELNSVGNPDDRLRYNAALRDALAPVKHLLCPDNQRRAETNPLRVLDSKDEADQAIIDGLPKIADYLGRDSKAHFDQVLAALNACGVAYDVNPRLVRGLDYYTRTTFEFTVTTGLGTQNALLGGGRYDGLSEILGGPRAPGIGFAIGEDRLILTLQAQADLDAAGAAEAPQPKKLNAYIAPLGAAQNPSALALARELRRAGLAVEVGEGSFKMRKSFDLADKFAHHIIILGEDEVREGTATLKTFATGEQRKLPQSELLQALR